MAVQKEMVKIFFQELETERLHLKLIGPEDADFILKQFSDDEVNRYLFDEEPYTSLEQAQELIEFYIEEEPRNQNRWILVKKENGEKIGTCGFHCWDREQGQCELGYDLYPSYWKQGYMQEALTAVLDFAKRKMQTQHIEANIAKGNQDSVRTVEKQGFIDTGRTYMEVFRGAEYEHSIYRKDF